MKIQIDFYSEKFSNLYLMKIQISVFKNILDLY